MIGTQPIRISCTPPSANHHPCIPFQHRNNICYPGLLRGAPQICSATRTRGRTERSSEMTDYWAALEIERGAGTESVKSAFRRLQKLHHPDNAHVRSFPAGVRSHYRLHLCYRFPMQNPSNLVSLSTHSILIRIIIGCFLHCS